MSWPTAQLKEVARVVGGATPKSAVEAYWDGEVHWATPKDLTNLQGKTIDETPRRITKDGLKSCAAELLPPNSVLFSSRAPIGHVAINTVPMATNQGFKSMVPGPKLDSNFLYWWLDANRAHLQSLGNGATFKEVSKSVVERVEIPLPPLDEQKRIAAILDQADTLRRLRQRAIDRLNTLGQAIFHEMFSGASVHNEDFRRVELSELIQKGDKINYGVVQPGDAVEGGVPLVRVGDLLKPLVNQSELKRISKSVEKKYSRSRLNGHEILVACVGSIGAIALADSSMSGFNIARAVARLPVDETKANRLFLAEQLKTQKVQRYFTSETRAVAQPTLNIKQLKETEIFLPSMKQQLKFAERLEGLRDHLSLHARGMEKIELLFASLQNRAFRGEL